MSAKDQYAQMAYVAVTESAASTLTYEELALGTEFGGPTKQAMVITRIEYRITASVLALLAAADDEITAGLSLSNSPTDTELNQAEIIDRLNIPQQSATSVGVCPVVKNFTDMPNGGIIIPAKKLYAFVQGVSIASAVTMRIRFWYQRKQLKSADYLELLEAYNILR